MITRDIMGLRRPVGRADNLATFIADRLEILGALTSWSIEGLSRPV
jgi:hypothetical protein